jgi:hypothetical protein
MEIKTRQMDGWINRRMERKNRHMDRQIYGHMDKQTDRSVQMEERFSASDFQDLNKSWFWPDSFWTAKNLNSKVLISFESV